ncbi:Coiled-Coil Domain-Containing Protein 38 [Manis pentadactyla]|nr:Coiled-Coil Domain-Containing Protein 38 [Manis pentadactyla]
MVPRSREMTRRMSRRNANVDELSNATNIVYQDLIKIGSLLLDQRILTRTRVHTLCSAKVCSEGMCSVDGLTVPTSGLVAFFGSNALFDDQMPFGMEGSLYGGSPRQITGVVEEVTGASS